MSDLPYALLTKHPMKRSQRYMSFSVADYIYCGIVAAVVLIGAPLLEGAPGGLVYVAATLGLAASLIISPSTDVRLYELPYVRFKGWYIRIVKKGVLWEEDQSDNGIPWQIYDLGDTALILNRKNNLVSFVLTAEGSNIASLDVEGQKSSQDLIAECIRAAAGSVSESVQISFGFRARPENPYVLYRALAQRGEASVVLHDTQAPSANTAEARREAFLHALLEELKPSIVDQSNDVEMYVLVSMHSTPELRRALKKRTILKRNLSRQPIMRLRNTVLVYFRDRIIQDQTVHVLDLEGAERFLRIGWDISGLEAYFEEAEQRWQSTEAKPTEWAPQHHISVGHDYVKMDGTYGATLKLTLFPVSQSLPYATPYQTREFYWTPARWHARAVIGQTVRGNLEYSVTKRGHGILKDAKDIVGMDQDDARSQRQAQEGADRLEELDKSGFAQYFNAYVAVSALTLEELEDEVMLEYERLLSAGYGPVRIVGEGFQRDAYLSAVTGLDLL